MPRTESRLIDHTQVVLRAKHYSIRSEKPYCYWIHWFIRRNEYRHPLMMGESAGRGCLTLLVVERDAGAGRQAASAPGIQPMTAANQWANASHTDVSLTGSRKTCMASAANPA